MNNVAGIDLSKWEGSINYQKLGLDDRAEFCFIKATEGMVSDNAFQTHRAGCKLAGIPWGAYHFYHPIVSPKRQAESFVASLGGDFGNLPLVLDIEKYDDSYGGYHGWRSWYDCLEQIKLLVPGKPIMIYTGYYYWRDRGIPWWRLDLAGSLNYFKQYPLWLAYYTSVPMLETPDARKIIPKPWDTWTFWQWSESGRFDAVPYDGVDLNYFNGDEEKFIKDFNLSEIPIPIPVPVPTAKTLTCTIKAVEGQPPVITSHEWS